jgi:hypothetical protein
MNTETARRTNEIRVPCSRSQRFSDAARRSERATDMTTTIR